MRRKSVWIVALALAALLPWQTARADTYVVTNTNDSGPGSLRQAITSAYNHPGADTITFDAATNGTPIVLGGAAGEDANASGDLDILDGGDLTIQGNGVANTIIDGGGIDRVFHVCPGGGCANTVTLSGVTIRNGSSGGHGGGIFNQGDTTVDDSAVSANTATYAGGGIFNTTAATLNVQNGSAIGGAGAGNTATNGGGIYNYTGGATTVDGSVVRDNTATNGGGGIYNCTGGATTVDGSVVRDNTATDGGGIYNYDGGATTVDGSVVRDNTATVCGGGIYNDMGTLNVQNGSTIGGDGAGNIAGGGGGIFNYGGATTVNGSTVSANTASDGGGLYTHSFGGTTVTGSRILNNTATTNGGGVYNDRDAAGATIVTGSCIVGNSAMSFFNDRDAGQIATGNW